MRDRRLIMLTTSSVRAPSWTGPPAPFIWMDLGSNMLSMTTACQSSECGWLRINVERPPTDQASKRVLTPRHTSRLFSDDVESRFGQTKCPPFHLLQLHLISTSNGPVVTTDPSK
ncbi:hypothetical protein BH10PLA2_BH10PLA2_24990 [soil metagenome]